MWAFISLIAFAGIVIFFLYDLKKHIKDAISETVGEKLDTIIQLLENK